MSEVTLQDLGIEVIEFDAFMERCLKLIKNPTSPEVIKRMRDIESHKLIGGNSTPLKCNHASNCTLRGSFLLKYAQNPLPEYICFQHLGRLKLEIKEKSWELFNHSPIVIEFAALVPRETSPRLLRARLKQFKDLT